MNWETAMVLDTTGHKGYSDWRVPNVGELQSLVKAGATNPAIDAAAFPATLSSGYWTSTTPDPINAFIVHFYSSLASADDKTHPNYVRLVRSGQCFYPFSRQPVTVTAVGTTTAAFTAASGFAATGYWVVVARNAQTPLLAQIRAGANYAGVTVVASGSVAMSAGSSASVAVTGLALGSQYDIYLWPERADSTIPGCVAMQPFATTAISTSAIVIDPATPTTLYAGLDGAGVYKKTSLIDWTAATTQPAHLRVKALVIKPGDSSKLFAATYGGGVFQSTDSGVNWNVACTSQPTNLNLLSLVVDAAGKLYAGSEAGVFVSSDSCVNWTALNTGMP
jgi:hypothetical protein